MNHEYSEHALNLLKNFYMLETEIQPEEAFKRASYAFSAGDNDLAERIFSYAKNGWFMFSSPILSNARLDNSKTGLPISCFLTYVPDTVEGLIDHSNELRWMSVMGGGVGGHWSDVRTVSNKAPGPIPFIKTVDSDMQAWKQGKCYHPDVEILTENGWTKFSNLEEGVKVAQVDDALNISFVIPIQLIKEEHQGSLIRLHDGTNIDVLVTPNHSMVVDRKTKYGWQGNLNKVRADELGCHSEVRMFKAGNISNTGSKALTSTEKLMIAQQADGIKTIKGSNLQFNFVKQRKINKLISICIEGGFDYKIENRKDGSVNIKVKFKDCNIAPDFICNDFNWVKPETRTTEWLSEFIDEISNWDATPRTDNSFSYCNTNETDAEVVFTSAVLCGRAAFLKSRDRSDENRLTIHNVHIHKRKHFTTQAIKKEEIAYNGFVYCALVPTGRLVIRSNGRSLICGNTRKGSYAAYINVSHPDIIEFINLRVPTGGDTNRKCFNINNAVCITDKFMNAVADGLNWDLIDPASNQVKETLPARELWQRILEVRFRTGEPYLFFTDTVNDALPESLKQKGLKVNGSNLCAEITLPTGPDRSAVCCLSSLNLEYFDEWKDTTIVEDCITFLDNVLQYFIDNAPKTLKKAIDSAIKERSLGLGTMGFHSYLQRKNMPWESPMAKGMNKRLFKHIKQKAVQQTELLAKTRGEYKDGISYGRRNSHLLAIAPNANSAIILDTSPSIEPWKSNAFTHRTRAGSFLQKNKYLDMLLTSQFGDDIQKYNDTWQSIILNKGSVQHLDCLTDYQKAVFKTAFEIQQQWLIEHAADRQEFICQSQSLNLFFPAGSDKAYVNYVHILAWKKKIKTLYYLRTDSGAAAEKISEKIERKALKDYDECIACQG